MGAVAMLRHRRWVSGEGIVLIVAYLQTRVSAGPEIAPLAKC